MDVHVSRRKQGGAVLVVSLIMLLLVTVMAISSFNLSQTNLKVVGNLESRAQAEAFAQAAIDEAISTALFASGSPNVFLNSCAPNTKCYSVGSGEAAGVTVTLESPRCVRVRTIRNSELDADRLTDRQCFVGGQENSLCAEVTWELRAAALDGVSGARATVRQGVSMRSALNDVLSTCPVN